MAFDLQSAVGTNIANTINNGFLNMHYLFAVNRPIFYGYFNMQEILITDTTTNNAFFNDPTDNAIVTKTFSTGMFLARVYETKSPELNPLRTNDPDVKGLEGTITIITDITGQQILSTANRIQYNNLPYRIASTPAVHGLLQRPFYTFTLATDA